MPFLYDASASWNLLVDFESLAIITFHFLPFTKDFFFFFSFPKAVSAIPSWELQLVLQLFVLAYKG